MTKSVAVVTQDEELFQKYVNRSYDEILFTKISTLQDMRGLEFFKYVLLSDANEIKDLNKIEENLKLRITNETES